MTLKQLVDCQGYAFLPSFLPNVEATDAALTLGVPEQVEGLRLVQELSPSSAEFTTPNTYSGNFGFGVFPFHTDLAHWSRPPRYLMLRCSRGDENIQTKIVDGKMIAEYLGSQVLARCLARPRRPLKGSLQLLPILQYFPEKIQKLIRWDSIYLKPANEYAVSIFEKIESYLSGIQVIQQVLLNQGDTLVLDNWRMLHGRSDVKSFESSRMIYSLYLSCLK